jgi:DNA-binding NarL/FixJ family response regulator
MGGPMLTEIVENLTRREKDLVRAIARGLTNRQIASEFGISEQTVKNHLTVVFHKLHVRTRLELAVHAMRQGLNR